MFHIRLLHYSIFDSCCENPWENRCSLWTRWRHLFVLMIFYQRCSYCKRFGATLMCIVPDCEKKFHFPCSSAGGCFQVFLGRTVICHIFMWFKINYYWNVVKIESINYKFQWAKSGHNTLFLFSSFFSFKNDPKACEETACLIVILQIEKRGGLYILYFMLHIISLRFPPFFPLQIL